MTWKLPPRIKIYEALGCIADKRIEIEGNRAKVFASAGNKFYDVMYDPDQKTISANDNGSYWQGYLGYPAIAFLMKKGLLPFEDNYAQSLKAIAWKDINTQFKNDWSKTEEWIYEDKLANIPVTAKDLEHFAGKVSSAIDALSLQKPTTRQRPPSGK